MLLLIINYILNYNLIIYKFDQLLLKIIKLLLQSLINNTEEIYMEDKHTYKFRESNEMI